MCWSDAELVFYNGEYRLEECESGIVFCRFYADNQIDAICHAASKYGIYSTIKALNKWQKKPPYFH